MNVEVLGDDVQDQVIMPEERFQSRRGLKTILTSRSQKGYMQGEYMGFDLMASLKTIGSTVVKTVGTIAKSDAGKAAGAAALTVAVDRLTPTQKAQAAQIQQAAGIPSYPIFSVSQSPVVMPVDGKTMMSQNLPYIIIGGAVLVGAVLMFATKRPRSAAVA